MNEMIMCLIIIIVVIGLQGVWGLYNLNWEVRDLRKDLNKIYKLFSEPFDNEHSSNRPSN